jgi:hypothetical protein
MPTLTIQLPGLPSVEHIVREDAITLGRMKGNSISLNDSSVSLSHAKITRVGSDFFLKDLNSTNGTMLNGQSITEARLRDGDQVKLGEVIAYFRVEPLASPVAAPAPAGSETAAATAPKPVAQSVPMPPVTVPANLPVVSPPASVFRPQTPLPPLPPPRKKSLRLPLFIGGGIGGLAAIGFVVWRFYSGTPAPVAKVPPVTQVAVPKKLSASNNFVAAKIAPAKTPVATAPDQNLAGLIKELKSPDVTARRHAAAAIYNLGTAAEPALPALPEALTDADPDVRMWTALAMVHNNVNDKATIPILIQTLHHENPTLRQVACLSLAMVPYTEAEKATVIPALTEAATKDESAEVANDALTALKIIAPDSVIGK